MKKILLLFTCLLLASLSNSAPDIPNLKLISPKQLSSKFKDYEIPFTLAKYGRIPYGSNFIGALVVAKTNGCEWIDHFSSGEDMYDQHLVVIVRKGACSHTITTRNAQNAGAKVVMIVNDKNELPNKVISDTSDDINVPTIIVKKEDGDKLIEFIEKLPFPALNPEDAFPIVSISFPYEEVSDTVALDFWYSGSDVDGKAYEFLSSFSEYARGEKAFKFTPHFVTWDCYECRYTGYSVPLEGDCISGGRYCAPDPDDEGPYTGSHVLFEDLRQYCIWEINAATYWNYVRYFPNRCITVEHIEEPEKCSYEILDAASFGLRNDQVKTCVEKSFITSKGTADKNIDDNSIFRKEKELQRDYGITEFPVLLINHKPYSGDLADFNAVMKKICSKVAPKPEVCRTLGYGGYSGMKVGVMITILVLLTVSATILFCGYRKVTKRNLGIELSTEANNMVSRYMAVSDLGGKDDI